MPTVRALSMARSIALPQAYWPKVQPQSTKTVADVSWTIANRPEGFNVPDRMALTYEGRRITPCESSPTRLLSTRDAATRSATSGGLSSASNMSLTAPCKTAADNTTIAYLPPFQNMLL